MARRGAYCGLRYYALIQCCVRDLARRSGRLEPLMFKPFSHFLSYAATDQQTARELVGNYDGLLVPGTVAAFQAEGTKGFVLTLSARTPAPRYAIDPRFPLFQQPLPAAKRSHTALAGLFGDPDLVQPEAPIAPEAYTDGAIDALVGHWLSFNRGFTELAIKKFDKYAQRLNEPILPENKHGPTWIIPPYFTALNNDDRWWPVSERFWRSAQAQARQGENLVRAVATDSAALLDGLLRQCNETELAIWVSRLDEAPEERFGLEDLRHYGEAIMAAASDGKNLFALYGGFFSVLLGNFGLAGSSHGIGYGEARAWLELPQSGPPPARYYLPHAHRYVSLDLALLFWQERRQLAECHCAVCGGQSPAYLDYHGLMQHSVLCRTQEIRQWFGLPPDQIVFDLGHEAEMFEAAIEAMDIPYPLRKPADRCPRVLRAWAQVISALTRLNS
jgi:hypothetical protein